jgi:hypothetical protein
MAATLLSSPAVETARARRSSPAPTLSANAAFVGLPLAFVLVGMLALCTGMIWLAAQPRLLAGYHYNQSVIAVTHLFVLGWISSVVMGAMYQLVPVALETKLYSERLARWHWFLHTVGFIGMVWMFSRWNLKQVGHFGSVLTMGVALFAYNLARTLRRVPRWSVTAGAVAAALTWVVLAVCAGLTIATAKVANDLESAAAPTGGLAAVLHGLGTLGSWLARFEPMSAMHAHAHLGVVGCFILLIVGVSYKLIPMFTLSEVQSRSRALGSVVLLNVGLAGAFVTILMRSPWKLGFTLVLLAALVLYGWELTAILRERKRRTLDWGIKSFLTGVALLFPLGLLAVVLSWPGLPLTTVTGQLENLYGFLGLAGVITLAIIGMLYKIVPFLVWFKSYSRQIGRARVPALAELYSERWQAAGYWAYLAGLAVAAAGIVSSSETACRVGCGLLAASLATLLFNVASMLTHFFKPKTQALATQPPGALKTA